MNIYDYVYKYTKDERQRHIDWTSLKNNTGCISSTQKKAIIALNEYLGTVGKTSQQVNLCHLCNNNSTKPNGFVCGNPEHLYFGTSTENQFDILASVRKSNARAGGLSSSNSPNQIKHMKRLGKEQGKKNVESGHLKSIAASGGAKSAKSDKSMNKQKKECEFCGVSCNLGLYGRWHGKNCKKNPDAPRYSE